ncbi:MAG: SPOR domain-containing protein [Rhodomicrobium sp.]
MQASGITRLIAIFGLGLAVFAWAPAGLRVAIAQTSEANGLFMLSRAQTAYESGDFAAATASLEEAFQLGLSKDLSARAILLRAQINERSGALARALQDYSNALWMDTLPAAQKKKASDGKLRVIAAMGLTPPAPAAAPAAPASKGGGAKQASLPRSSPAAPQPAPGSSSGGVLGMFDGLFGSSETPAAAPVSQPNPPAPQTSGQTAAAAPVPAPARPVVSASATPVLTRTKEANAEPAMAPRKPPHSRTQPAAAPIEVRMASIQPVSMTSGSDPRGFMIVFGSAGNEGGGRTKARQIKAALADILVSRELDVEPAPEGGYQIVAGPYKTKSAALALCSAMKQRGVPCQVTQ